MDLARRFAWIHPDQSKNSKPIPVPLNNTAARVIVAQTGGHARYVFHYKGHAPINNPAGAAWRNALKRASITDFRWHDLRHTWASWLRQAGVGIHDLQELGGWKTDAMVKRYAHLGLGDLAQQASVIDSIYGTTTTQSKNKGVTLVA